MNDYHKAIYEAEEFMGGPATPPKGTTMATITDAQDRAGMRAARLVAQWHLGDPNWADKLIGAYLAPEVAIAQLRVEKEHNE